MKTVFKPLADLEFANLLAESFAETKSGENLLNKYRQFLLKNESSCNLVNNFMNEAKNCMFDKGVAKAVRECADVIADNRVSWQLATACECINNNHSSYNYLNRNAASTVEKLLEQNEEQVVKYIKAGALKNVMFCEAFRTIVNGVFTDVQNIVTENYTAVRPVSFMEDAGGKKYFEVLGRIYALKDNEILEANASEVSGDFLIISRLMESGAASYNANDDTLTVNTPLAVYEVCKEDDVLKCKRTSKKNVVTKEIDKKGVEGASAAKDGGNNVNPDLSCNCKECITFTNADALREHNRLVVGATAFAQRNQVSEVLEALARAFEHFDQFVLLDNTQIISSPNDKFVVIENKDHACAYSIASNHNTGWKVNTTIVEALDFIKKQTNLNIAKDYKDNVDEQIAKSEEESAKQIKEAIKNDEMAARKAKIEMLTEKFKDDPARLAVLSKIAEELTSVE